MQNAKNTANVAVKLTAQELQQQFNIVTNDLFSTFGYKDIKPSIDNLLLGWIGSDTLEQIPQPERIATLDFFTRLLVYSEKAEKEKNNEGEVKINLFIQTMNLNFDHHYKEVKHYLKNTFSMFLTSEISNDFEIRNDVVYRVEVLQ